MDKLLFLLMVLVANVASSEDFIHLYATEETQNLTSPSLEGISRPYDFKWRIWRNITEEYSNIVAKLLYLNVQESNNCSGSYIEVFNGNESLGRKCSALSDEIFFGNEDYLDVIYHIGREGGTPKFQLSFYQNKPFIATCFFGYPGIPIWAIILLIAIMLICVTTTCCCVYRHCRKGHRNVAKKNGDSPTTEKGPSFVPTGPPSYDDVIKGDDKPPPYASVVDYA